MLHSQFIHPHLPPCLQVCSLCLCLYSCPACFSFLSEAIQSCLTLCNPMDWSLSGSSIHGIFQARVLEWVAISFSRGSSQPRDQTQVSRIVGRRFTIWATREAHLMNLCGRSDLATLFVCLITFHYNKNHTPVLFVHIYCIPDCQLLVARNSVYLTCGCCLVAKWCPTLCGPMDC